MCFPRKPCLGHYNATRMDWHKAYRAARITARRGGAPNPAHSGVQWKAELIVFNERDSTDPLACPVAGRLFAYHLFKDECQ